MSISTKSGDNGKTDLWSGERVWKDDERIESYGTIDELNSFLGEAKHHVTNPEILKIIKEIQNELYRVGSELASKDKKSANPILDEDVELLTNYVHHFEKDVELTGFIVPGGTIASGKLDICRTIARRAERHIIRLSKKEKVPEVLIKFVNRLSDLIYIMARTEEKDHNKITPQKKIVKP